MESLMDDTDAFLFLLLSAPFEVQACWLSIMMMACIAVTCITLATAFHTTSLTRRYGSDRG